MIQENKKEILTNEKIEIDIKEKHKWKTKENVITSILLLIFMFISFSFVELKLEFRFLFSNTISFVLVLLNIFSDYLLFKNIYILVSKKTNYSIFVDRYVGTINKRIGKYVIPCLVFEKYGKFELHNREKYYSWSSFLVMDNKGLKRTSHKDDLFYVVLINNKIVCLYNQELFELQ